MRDCALQRFEVVAPAITNTGDHSGYPEAFRRALLAAGIDGWSEWPSVGYWRGKSEPGMTFTLYLPARIVPGRVAFGFSVDTLDYLAVMARDCMPDQEAIQVTRSSEPVTIREA